MRVLQPGDTFGFWTLLSRGKSARGESFWLCRCRCLTIREIAQAYVKSGRTPSCRCATRKDHMPERRIWSQMKRRCEDPRASDYPTYGGVEVTVDTEWSQSFERFFAAVGPMPGSAYTLDRIDNSRGYEPGNVRWAPRQQQARNRRNNTMITWDGVSMCLSAWAERLGVDRHTIGKRLQQGWSLDQALNTPSTPHALRRRAHA